MSGGAIAERLGQQLRRQPAGGEGPAGIEAGDEDPGRAEQHRVDLVEVEAGILEDPARTACRSRARPSSGSFSASSRASSSGPVTNSCTSPPNRIASLVRPIAVRKSGDGGGRGAVPRPSRTRSSGKPSAWTLCSATSSTRAVIWTVPARLVVGVRMKVSAEGARPQSAATCATSSSGGGAVGLQHEEAPERLGVGVAELGEQLLLGGPRAARPGGHGEVGALALAVAQAPAGVLAGEAGEDRIAGRDRDPERPGRERRARGRARPGRGRPCRSRRSGGRPRARPAAAMPASTIVAPAGARARRAAAAAASRQSCATSGCVSRPRLGRLRSVARAFVPHCSCTASRRSAGPSR